MALTANRDVPHFVDQQLRAFKVGGGETIYKGAFVSVDSSGYGAALAAGETCIGLAFEECDNSTGSDGDKSIRCYTQGDFEYALSGAAVTNIGDAVYASADDTLTFTSTANSFVGYCVDVPSSGTIILRIAPFTTVAA